MSYNGWTNRETWLVNLHFGDGFIDLVIESQEPVTPDQIEACIEDYVAEALSEGNIFISDLLDLGAINYHELAEAFNSEIEEEEQDE